MYKLLLVIFITVLLSCEKEGEPLDHYDVRIDQRTVVINAVTYDVTVLEAQKLPLSPKVYYAIGVDDKDFQLVFTDADQCVLESKSLGKQQIANGWTAVIHAGSITVIKHSPDSAAFSAAFLAVIKK